ncbi:receptor-type tyrosine-protein phosphatase H isoform X1 [Oncorhynchus clarkii lewisi]|uniref:receptor-type tyrosine-protein phosphatase H isoform X1 n=1 Tax=Oncorhynchus clarkii lewisi TaxID=490388 RepID=UPI0039B9AE50
MGRIQHLILWAVLVVCCVAERQYFFQSNSSTWEQARLHCQVCYKEMVSLTPENIQQLAQNLTSSYWIGLRKTMNNGSFPWSRWSNGNPLAFQNWYPGRPILSKPKNPVNIFNNYYSIRPNYCGCCCTNNSNSTSVPPVTTVNSSYHGTDFGNSTDYLFTGKVNMTASSTKTPAVTKMTSAMTGSTFFTGVTGGINGTNMTSGNNGTNETETDVYIEEPCIAMLSFGLWFDKICSELLPYICYEDRFYGNATMTNKTLHSATLSWTRGPGDISGYRMEVKSTDYNLTLNHSSLNQTYDLSNLTAGTQYRVQVFPIKCGRDLNPQNVSFYTKPGVIQKLNVANVSETSIFLTWFAPEGNHDLYNIQVRGEPDLKMTTRTESALVKGLIPGGLYTFEVNAEVEDKSIEGDRLHIPSYTKPGMVSNLKPTALTNDSVRFQWEPPTGNTSGYRAYAWREGNNGTVDIFRLELTYTTLTVGNQSPGAKIWLSVVALVPDGSVEGEPSKAIGRTTPGEVTNLLLDITEDTIRVSWTPPQGNYETFSVQLKLNASNKEVETENTTNSQLSFTKLKAGAEYLVTVTTLNGYLKSYPISTANFTLPLPPQSAQINFFNKSHVTLSWKAPVASQGVQIMYLVKYITEFWNDTQTYETHATNYTFHELHAGTNYTFEVRVKAGTQESQPVQTSQTTSATVRVRTMTLACSSSEPSICEDSGTRTEVLQNLISHFRKWFSKMENETLVDKVFWELEWRGA